MGIIIDARAYYFVAVIVAAHAIATWVAMGWDSEVFRSLITAAIIAVAGKIFDFFDQRPRS